MESLSDPLKDRAIKQFKPPPHKPLSTNLMFPQIQKKDQPNWKLVRDHLFKEGKIFKIDLIHLITKTNIIFKNEGNIISLQDPITVVGDIHGQFYDLLKMLEVGGDPDSTKYLFLGDFVDRGSFSVEVLILLYAIKVCHEKTVFFLRGNHECRQMTSFFNFRDECKNKYDQEIYELFMDSFDLMPISAIINGKFLALHGGISPEFRKIADLNKLNRFNEPPKQGLFCDILWSDPINEENGKCDNVFKYNDVRGCSYFFGYEAVKRFLDQNNLLAIVRAHEAQLDGYKMHKWNQNDSFPVIITIFSAPNYCDIYNNKGALLKFYNNTLNIQQYGCSPHPYLLPNFMDVFTWSIPFLTEKILEIFFYLVKSGKNLNAIKSDEEEEMVSKKMYKKQNSKTSDVSLSSKKKNVLRNKIKFISKMLKFQKTLRENQEEIIKMKNVKTNNKLPCGILGEGKEKLSNLMSEFEEIKKMDQINEKRPDFMPKIPNSIGIQPKKLF